MPGFYRVPPLKESFAPGRACLYPMSDRATRGFSVSIHEATSMPGPVAALPEAGSPGTRKRACIMNESALTAARTPVALTREHASKLKRQNETPQGLRDQLLLCLLLNEKLSVRVISELRATSVDLAEKVLVLPSGEEELPLTDETWRTLQVYVEKTTPTGYLLQGSVSSGELNGSMKDSSIYVRVEHLGHALGLPGKLTVEACHAYRDPALVVPQVRRRVRRSTAQPLLTHERAAEAALAGLLSPPVQSIDVLVAGLAQLDEWLGEIQRIRREGDLSLAFEELCLKASGFCAPLLAELTGLQQVISVFPLHAMLVRLFPRLEEGFSEALLLSLEWCAIASLSESLTARVPRHAAEDRAYRACEQLARSNLGGEQLAECADLLRSMVGYASMVAQRRIQAP